MSRPRLAILSVLPLGLLAACAGMPMDAPRAPGNGRATASAGCDRPCTRHGAGAVHRAAAHGGAPIGRNRCAHARAAALALCACHGSGRYGGPSADCPAGNGHPNAARCGACAGRGGDDARPDGPSADGVSPRARARRRERSGAAQAARTRNPRRLRAARPQGCTRANSADARAPKPRTTSARRLISAAAGSASARRLARGSAARSCGWDRRQAPGPTQRWRHPDPGAETPRRHRGNSPR